MAALLVVRGTLLIIYSFKGGSVADPKNIWVVKSKIYYTNTPHHHEPTCTPRRARWCSTSCSPSCRRAYTWTRTPACTGSRSPPRSSCRTQSCIAGRSPAVKIFKVTLKIFCLEISPCCSSSQRRCPRRCCRRCGRWCRTWDPCHSLHYELRIKLWQQGTSVIP